ncbi:MAG: FHIPEP family type III secretion protein, partial [Bdellovibrionales bacterium]|nr:FHIPEP family type III secretion protein [Bdellovibrionales bacterium]
IVTTFGRFVVQGNVVVGMVVFLIITLVQFLVIAKGAERVAEVAARFTLDAMPGKQMAIDADVRAGMLSLSEAKLRRRELQRESKLYGALDGAMKFVKGDAIAGLVITAVNITAGMIVGTVYHGLSFGEAFQRFALFTVGDGLVSQIPALLVAVAAGIAVTRVSDEQGSFVGREVVLQLGREPQTLSTTGGVLVLLALVPGIPSLLFCIMGMLLITAAGQQRRTLQREQLEQREAQFQPRVYSAFLLLLSPSAVHRLQVERNLPARIRQVRTRIFNTAGVLVPDLQFEVDQTLAESEACLLIRGSECARLDAPQGLGEQIAAAVENYARDHLAEFLDDTQTRTLFETHHPVCEDLIQYLVPSVISVTGLTKVLRQLVSERVSIRDFHSILQAVSEYHAERDPASLANLGVPERGQRAALAESSLASCCDLVSFVRARLARSIVGDLVAEGGTLGIWSVPNRVDLALSKMLVTQGWIEPELQQRMLHALRQLTKEAVAEGRPVLVCSSIVRSSLAQLALDSDGEIAVLSSEEILPGMNVEWKGDLEVSVTNEELLGELPQVASVPPELRQFPPQNGEQYGAH